MKNYDFFHNDIGEAYVIADQGSIIEVNEEFLELTGYTEGELLNKNIESLFKSLRIGPNFKAGNISEHVEYFLFTKSLEVRFVYFKEIKKNDFRIKYVVTEKSGSRLEDKFSYVCQLLNEDIVGISIYSAPDLTLLKANKTYLEFNDAPFNTRENAFGRLKCDLIPGYAGSNYEAINNDLIEKGTSHYLKEFAYHGFKRGATYWDEIVTPVKENGKVRYIITNTQEVTEVVLNKKEIKIKNSKLLKYEKNFERQKELLESVVNNLQESLYVFDNTGNYLLRNSLLDKLKSNNFSNMKQLYEITTFQRLDGSEIPIKDTAHHKVLNGQTIKNDIICNKSDGTTHYFLVNGTPVLDDNNQLSHGIVNTLEITDLVHSNILLDEAQKQLLQAEHDKNQALEQAMAMKDEFLSLISHELRTPITVIDSATQAIQYICWDELPEKAQRYIKIIKQNTYRQLRLVNNLLDIMRVNAGRIKINAKNIDIVFLSKNIVDSVFPYADKGGIKLEFISEFDKKVIGIDDEKYERILLNLLSNAIKYTPEGKSICVSISSIDNKICIKVKDTGIGIPEDKLDLIFERFGQVDSLLSRRAEGAGIGLSLTKKFTEAIGGSISVKSQSGKGSTFTLLLPDKAAAEEASEAQDIDISENRHVEICRIEFSDIYF